MLPITIALVTFIVVAVRLVCRMDRAMRKLPPLPVGPRLRLIQRAVTGLLFALALLALSVAITTAPPVQVASLTLPPALARSLWAHHEIVVVSSVLLALAEPLLAWSLRAAWANLRQVPRIMYMLVMIGVLRVWVWRLRRQFMARAQHLTRYDR